MACFHVKFIDRVECENSQVDFSHEEYSIELRNRNFLSINWYEPELSDIEWVILRFI